MANTTKGYPYPVGTDRVMDGDNAIQALAEAVDSRASVLASGLASVPLNSQVQASVTVTFPAGRFTVAPNVVATTTSGNYIAMTAVPTTTNVQIWASSKAGTATTGTVTVSWIAHQS